MPGNGGLHIKWRSPKRELWRQIVREVTGPEGDTDVVQSCGRITRGGNGRNYPPLVIDVVDTFSGIFQAQARKRLNFYRKSGMLVESSN
jgi:hypothetical protein